MEGKEARRADRHQRDERHANRGPAVGHRGNSLARDGWSSLPELALLLALILLVACALGIEDRSELEEHARWQAELEERGAWVMW